MNLTVLVGTCDAYSSLWDNFTKCYKKYWPYDTNIIFAGETKTHSEYNTCTPGANLPWGQRIKKALEHVETDYVFFLLEDYFLSYQYPEDQIKTWLLDMDRMGMFKLQISRSCCQLYEGTNDRYLKFHPQSDYLFSMQPSIWHKAWISKNMPDHFSPHEFEVSNSQKYKNKQTEVYIDASINFPVYFNAVRKGFVKSEGWEDFKNKENLENF